MARGGRAEWNGFQADLLRACNLPGVSLVIATTAVRTGKTGAQAAFHRYRAQRNPRVRSVWLVESYKWYKRTALPVCRQLFGREATWHGTDYTWTWPAFGNAQVVVCTYVDLNSMQGVTAGWGSIDEAQNMGPDAHAELEQRISDSRVETPCILITGLPVFGGWPDQLAADAGAVDIERATELVRAWERTGRQGSAPVSCVHFSEIQTRVNARNVHSQYLERMRERLDPDEYTRRVEGIAPAPVGGVFRHWVAEPWSALAPLQGGNLIDWMHDPALFTVLDIDFGVRRAACVASQMDKKRDIQVLFDEHNLDDTNTRALCILLRETYVPRSMHSHEPHKRPLDEIACDPAGNSAQTAEALTDIKVLREYFPGVRIRYTYVGRLRKITAGIAMVNARILSAAGKRRLLMSSALWARGMRDRRTGDGYTAAKRGRSMALTLVRLKYPKDRDGRALSDAPESCPVDLHCADALRYGIINRYGMPESGQFQAT